MFTSIMYGFINEVTRQPEFARLSLSANRGAGQRRPVAHPRRKTRQVASAARHRRHPAGTYRVLADSFKRAAGFY